MDLLKRLDDKSVHCCITSPPYWGLRDYGVKGQIGLEKTPQEYVKKMVTVFREVRRVLRDDGTLWLNLGDSYASNGKNRSVDQALKKTGLNGGLKTQACSLKQQNKIVNGLKPKDLIGIPWRVALALQADGWYLRQDIIWSKPNPMPESVTDRCTKSHEYIFLLSKSAKYYFDNEAIREPAGEKGNANSFRGGAYCNGNKDNALLGKRTVSGNTKRLPSGWDVGPGSHGSFHKDGRGSDRYSFKRKTDRPGPPGAMDQHREGRADIEYCGTRNKRSVWTIEDHNSLLNFLETNHPDILKSYFNHEKDDVWTCATYPYKKAHFATFPPKLIEPCVLAGCPKGGIILDIFSGSGTTSAVAFENGRQFLGLDLSPDYVELSKDRIRNVEPNIF
jgi:site-specific DNA-methyltransferase (adenine-specific)